MTLAADGGHFGIQSGDFVQETTAAVGEVACGCRGTSDRFDDDGADRRSAGVAEGARNRAFSGAGVIVVFAAAFAQQRSSSRFEFECDLSDIAA
jgi:hypothetical protein